MNHEEHVVQISKSFIRGSGCVCVRDGGLYLYLEIIKVLSEDFMFNEDHDKFTYIKAKNNRNTN